MLWNTALNIQKIRILCQGIFRKTGEPLWYQYFYKHWQYTKSLRTASGTNPGITFLAGEGDAKWHFGNPLKKAEYRHSSLCKSDTAHISSRVRQRTYSDASGWRDVRHLSHGARRHSQHKMTRRTSTGAGRCQLRLFQRPSSEMGGQAKARSPGTSLGSCSLPAALCFH